MGRIIDRLRSGIEKPRARNPFASAAIRVIRGRRLDVETEFALESHAQVLVGLVSLPLNPPLERKDCTYWNDPHPLSRETERIVLGHRSAEARDIVDCYISAIEEALAAGAKVICCNELAFPTVGHAPSLVAAEEAQRLAAEARAFIVGGTAHDHRTLYNRAHLFYPGCTINDGDYYLKQLGASWEPVGERVNTPPMRRATYARACRLQLATLICSDLLDYLAVSAVIKVPQPRVEVLLVPCYSSGTDRFRYLAKTISLALGGYVILVNGDIPSRWKRIAYKFGEEITDDCEDWVDPVELPKGGTLALLKIDREKLLRGQDARDRAIERDDEDLRYLFGLEDEEPR